MRQRILALACLVVTSSGQADTLIGRVVAITDGDTLVIQAEHGRQEIRVAGIDAPERVQSFGARSRANLGQWVFQKHASAECLNSTGNAPKRCVVRVDGEDVGLRQLRDGMAWWVREDFESQTPEALSYQQAETMARLRRLGLWSETNPRPPWDWRKLSR